MVSHRNIWYRIIYTIRARAVRLSCATLVLCMASAAVPAWAAGDRVALIIGNGRYQAAPTLPNPPNDARTIGAVLQRLNFDVETVVDQNRSQMEQAIRRLGDRAARARVVLFYYAGHGLQVNGANYL